MDKVKKLMLLPYKLFVKLQNYDLKHKFKLDIKTSKSRILSNIINPHVFIRVGECGGYSSH